MAAANDSKMDEQIDNVLRGNELGVGNDTLLSIANLDDRHRIESLTQQLLDLQQLHSKMVHTHQEEKVDLLGQIERVEHQYQQAVKS